MKKSKIKDEINQLKLGLEELEKKVERPADTTAFIDSLLKAGYVIQVTAPQYAQTHAAQLPFAIPDVTQPQLVIVPKQDKRMRKQIHQAIGNLVDQSGLSWNQAWDKAYSHLHTNTGFHVWSRFAEEGHANKLEACAYHNMLPALHHIVMRMLATKDYSAVATLVAV